MKTIYLVRHAQAVKGKKNVPDHERPLVRKGEKKAKSLALKLKKNLIRPDVIISSQAERALGTSRILADILRYPSDQIILKTSLYKSKKGKDFLKIVKELEGKIHSALIVGHEPTLSELATLLVPSSISFIPNAGIMRIDFEISTWKGLVPGKGSLGNLKFQEKKNKSKKILKKCQKSLTKELIGQISECLANVDKNVVKHMKKPMKKTCKGLSEQFMRLAKASGDKTLMEKLEHPNFLKPIKTLSSTDIVEKPTTPDSHSKEK